MFDIGDKIFYPNHGAGIVEAIESKEMFGESKQYYILTMQLRSLQIMIPTGRTANLGLRQIVDLPVLEDVLAIINDGEPDLSMTSGQRHRLNLDKMKSGDIYEGAEVIRDLQSIARKRSLGSGDKMMLDNAMQMLMSEVMLVKGIASEQASALLHRAINN